MEIDKTVRLILVQNTSYINIYVFKEFSNRKINVQKISKKLTELYGEYYDGHQFLKFGETYLNEYLIEKHGLDFNEFLMVALEPVYNRFKHLS